MKKMEAAGELLPDDVVLEILLRVPGADVAATLFRCAVACKRWRALIVDHSFLRRRPEVSCHRTSLRGFFVRCPHGDGSLQPVFLPPPSGSVLGSRPRSLPSFFPGLQHGELDGAVPLVARHGLLLVRLARRANDDPARLAVCNLLAAGTCVMLPSLKRGVLSVNCAIISGADCRSSKGHLQRSPLPPDHCFTFFKVLAIVMDDSRNDQSEWNNLYTFSSPEPGWSEPANCFDVVARSNGAILQWRNKVVVCRGVAHWLVLSMSKYYILGVSIETGHISLTELPFPEKLLSTTVYDEPTLFVTADGSPSLLWLKKKGLELDIWTMQEDNGGWLHARTVELKPPRAWNPSSVHVWSGEKSGVLLIIDTFRCVHMVDVESGAMEDVSQQFRSSWGMMAVPMEIDWPTLFMSRLGGG